MTPPAIDLRDDIQPVSEFRANAAEALRRIRESGRPLVLTHNGRSAAVVMDVGAYQAMVDELGVLRDVAEALAENRDGRTTPHEAAKAEVLAQLRR